MKLEKVMKWRRMGDMKDKRKAFMSALRHVCYAEGVTIGSYVGSLEKENEDLSAANNNLKKEIHILKNYRNIDVDHPSNKFF